MDYNEIFSVSSSVNLIPPKTKTCDQPRSPTKSRDDLKQPSAHILSPDQLSSSDPPSNSSPSRGKNKCSTGYTLSEADADDGGQSKKPDTATDEEPIVVAKGDRHQASATTEAFSTDEGEKRSDVFGFCYCRRELLAVKLFYFSFIGALGVIFPYCAVFLKQIGLSAFQIGVISGVRPALGFISAPIWGSLADRFNIRRAMMIVSMLAWLGFFVGFYFITPPARLQTPYPEQPELHRPHMRFRRSDDQPELPVAADNDTLRWNSTGSGCNYSDISEEDKKLLRENLSWIYDLSDVNVRFVISFLIICGGELFQSPTTAMTDAATLQILGRENVEHYGAQRAWGPIGWAISSLAVGSLLNANRWQETVCGIELVFSDYRIIAYVFIAIMIFGIAAGFHINFGTSKEERHDSGGFGSKVHNTMAVFKLFLNVHYGSWILTTFFVGLLNGLIWGFLFWHLDNLGGSKLLMGIDSVVMCLFEFASFFVVYQVIKVVGHMGIMYIGLVGYAVRLIVYASMTNPWVVLPADALQGVTFSFIWVSLTGYTAVAVPCASLATVQGIVHGVYFGLGNGLGHLIGGILIGEYGAVITFYSFGVATIVWLFLFVLCQKLSKKPNFDQFSYQDLSGPEATTSLEDQTPHRPASTDVSDIRQ